MNSRFSKGLILLFFFMTFLASCREEEWDIIVPEEASRSFDRPVTGLYPFGNKLIAVVGNSKEMGFEGSGFQLFTYDRTNWINILPETTGQVGDIQEFRGELYITGRFDIIAGINSPNLARWDGEIWKAVGTGIDFGTSGDISLDYWWSVGGLSLEIMDDNLYIGGGSLEGRNNLVVWDGGRIMPLIEYSDGAWCEELVVLQNSLYGAVTVSEPFIARFDGTRWSRMSQTAEDWSSMTVHQDKIYGSPGIWNGTQFETFRYPAALGLIKSIGDNLYTIAHFTENNTVMRWDGREWYTAYQPPVGWEIFSIAEYWGDIFVGGEFLQNEDPSLSIIVLE